MSTIIVAKPEVEISAEIKAMLQLQPENFTILHCKFMTDSDSLIRIWPQTFLIEQDDTRKKLVKPFNISIMPTWTIPIIVNNFVRFTLLFEGLSKSCTSFSMLEDIPEPGGFYSTEIMRNKTDVYSTEIRCKEA